MKLEAKSFKLTKISVIIGILVISILLIGSNGIGTAKAQEGGPITIWGQVYKSDGTPVGAEYDGTYVAVVIDHAGERTTHFDDTGGLENGIYTVTIPEGDWSQGDTYWVTIIGEAWGDLSKHNAEGIKVSPEQKISASGTDHWVLSGPGSVRRDIIALSEELSPLPNLEPLLAIVFAIIIAILGTLFLTVLDKQKVNVVVIDKSDFGVHGKKGRTGVYGYTCGYGRPTKPTELGELFGTSINLNVDSFQNVSVKKILRAKNGEYHWYKPKIIFDQPPTQIDSAYNIDTVWFAGGAVELEKGELPQHAVRMHTALRFVGMVLPFVVLELVLAGVSAFDLMEGLTIPPWLSLVFLLNVIFLVVGIVLPLGAYWRASKVKRLEAPPAEVVDEAAEPELAKFKRMTSLQSSRSGGPGPAPQGVLSGVVEDFPITPQRYLPPAQLATPIEKPQPSKPSPPPTTPKPPSSEPPVQLVPNPQPPSKPSQNAGRPVNNV